MVCGPQALKSRGAWWEAACPPPSEVTSQPLAHLKISLPSRSKAVNRVPEHDAARNWNILKHVSHRPTGKELRNTQACLTTPRYYGLA